MKIGVNTFVDSCIYYISTTGGGRVPLPYGSAFHGTAANDLFQFNYIEDASSVAGDKYVLMIRDFHSDYNCFFAFPGVSAEKAAQKSED